MRARGLRRHDGRRFSRYRFRHFPFQKYLYGPLDAVERVALHERVGLALAAAYGWFTEGLDTADLRDAGALLDDLACGPRPPPARPALVPGAGKPWAVPSARLDSPSDGP